MEIKSKLIDQNSSKEYAFMDKKTAIGRAENNDIVLDDGTVSKYHAKVTYWNRTLRLIDLNSTNGIKVNGNFIKNRILKDGDIVEIGLQRLKYSCAGSGKKMPVNGKAVFIALLAIFVIFYFVAAGIKNNSGNNKDKADKDELYNEGMKDYINREKDINYLKNAVNKWNEALSYDKNSVKIQKSLEIAKKELRSRAMEIYLAGNRMADSRKLDEAVKLWREVQNIVSKEDSLWYEAEKRIREAGKK